MQQVNRCLCLVQMMVLLSITKVFYNAFIIITVNSSFIFIITSFIIGELSGKSGKRDISGKNSKGDLSGKSGKGDKSGKSSKGDTTGKGYHKLDDKHAKYRDETIEEDPLGEFQDENSVTVDGFDDFTKLHDKGNSTNIGINGIKPGFATNTTNNRQGSGGSSSYDEETPLGGYNGVELNERKKRKHKKKKRKRKAPDMINEKIKQLEAIYDSQDKTGNNKSAIMV